MHCAYVHVCNITPWLTPHSISYLISEFFHLKLRCLVLSMLPPWIQLYIMEEGMRRRRGATGFLQLFSSYKQTVGFPQVLASIHNSRQ